jgi:AcrR family transcriptional regulator
MDTSASWQTAAQVVPEVRATDRRTRHRERRHQELYAAAVELFVEQGFENTTMEQIAERADVARATVFNHFERKTAFLDEWMSQRRKRAFAAVCEENLTDWSLDRILRRYMIESARMSEETRAETVALMTATVHSTDLLAHPVLAEEFEPYIVEAQKSGEAPAEMKAGVAGLVVATSYFAVLSQWIAVDPAPFDLTTELLAMLDILLSGVLKRS